MSLRVVEKEEEEVNTVVSVSVTDGRLAKDESAVAERWLHWCRSHQNVKCIESPVPNGILPAGYTGTVIDVKVHGGKKRCPDDKIYNRFEELRSKVARGSCVLKLKHLSDATVTITSYVFLIFALKKFSGGMGDEDEDSASCQNLWRNYFLKSIDCADKVVVTTKANGEAGHLSCRRIGGQTIFCLGSKNVHLLARHSEDLHHYTESRFGTALVVAEAFFSTYLESPLVSSTEKKRLMRHLLSSRQTAVMEVLQPAFQHIEDISHLTRPELRFICWTSMYSEDESDSLCSVAPNVGIDLARSYGLSTISYEAVSPQEAEGLMLKIRREAGYEGKVLYFLDSDENVIGLIKKKTAWYIILRAIREKACYFTSKKVRLSKSEMDEKVIRRISELQGWLGFSDVYRRKWETTGVAFVRWLLVRGMEQGDGSLSIRAKFPQLWKDFVTTHDDYKDLLSLNYT